MGMSVVALSELLGATVRDASGTVKGRVREIAVTPQDHPTRVAFLIVRTTDGDQMLPSSAVKSCGATVRATSTAADWQRYAVSDGVLLLKRDLLDQQIIDALGRKVVRVTDVTFQVKQVDGYQQLNVLEVDIGMRSIFRRLGRSPFLSISCRRLKSLAGRHARRNERAIQRSHAADLLSSRGLSKRFGTACS